MNITNMNIPSKSIYQLYCSKLTKSNILNRIRIYGFKQCADMYTFLSFVCDEETLDLSSLRYIYGKVTECLSIHNPESGRDNNNYPLCYFQDLRVLKQELEFVISLSIK